MLLVTDPDTGDGVEQEPYALDDHVDVDDQINLKQMLNIGFCALTLQEERVLRLRYGLADIGCHTYREIADLFDIPFERVRQLELRAHRKLIKRWISRGLWSAADTRRRDANVAARPPKPFQLVGPYWGLHGDAHARWAIFERSLNAEYLRAHLKRLPDFDDEEAEIRALAYVAQSPDLHQALTFLIDWPAQAKASELVLTRHRELDGDQYWLLTSAAEALDEKHPLAATLVLRSMITFSLDRAKHTRYGHAARHLQTCEYLAKRIEDFGVHVDHQAFVAGLRLRHGRKTGFWNA